MEHNVPQLYDEKMIENLSEKSHEEICQELYSIKKDLDWLNHDISLTLKQRHLFNDIQTRVKNLLGCNRH